MARRSRSSKRSQSSLSPDMLILIGLTILIFMSLPSTKTISKQRVWNSADTEPEVHAKILNKQYGSVEDNHSRAMEQAQSFTTRSEPKGIVSRMALVRDKIKDIFEM